MDDGLLTDAVDDGWLADAFDAGAPAEALEATEHFVDFGDLSDVEMPGAGAGAGGAAGTAGSAADVASSVAGTGGAAGAGAAEGAKAGGGAPGGRRSRARAGGGERPRRRGPGRPPKHPPPRPRERRGVVAAPTDPAYLLELVYDQPKVFRDLFGFFKGLHAIDVTVAYGAGGVKFFTRDAGGANRAVADLPGAPMNLYFCAEPAVVHLRRENVEKVFASIDKSFTTIGLVRRRDDANNLVIVFRDEEIAKESVYRVRLSDFAHDEELLGVEQMASPAALRAYPIEFRLSVRQLKKTVVDASNYATTLSVEKYGGAPFQFSYVRDGFMYSELYHDPRKIDMRADLAPGQVFHAEVKIGHIKPLANAMIFDSVRVYCHDEADMVFCSRDGALTLYTFTRLQ